MAIRSTTHASTKDTPFFLMTGRDFVAPYAPRKHQYAADSHYAQELISRLQLAYQEVCENQADAFAASKEQFDKRAKPVPFAIGQIVYVKNFVVKPGSTRKFTPKFLGPYRIIEKLGEATFRLRQIYGRKLITAHAEKLKAALMPGSPFVAEYDKESQPQNENLALSSPSYEDSDSSSQSDSEQNAPLQSPVPGVQTSCAQPDFSASSKATESDSDCQDIESEAHDASPQYMQEAWIYDPQKKQNESPEKPLTKLPQPMQKTDSSQTVKTERVSPTKTNRTNQISVKSHTVSRVTRYNRRTPNTSDATGSSSEVTFFKRMAPQQRSTEVNEHKHSNEQSKSASRLAT